MRHQAYRLIALCVFTAIFCGMNRLAAQAQTLQSPALQSPLLQSSTPSTQVAPQISYQTTGKRLLPGNGRQASANTNTYLLWPQRVGVTVQDLRVQENAVRDAQQKLDAELRKLAEMQRKLGNRALNALERAQLGKAVLDQQIRVASRRSELLAQQANRNAARIILQLPRPQPQLPFLSTQPTLALPNMPYTRNLLFTPADATQVSLFHPLITPETTAKIIPLPLVPQQPPDAAHR